MRLDVSCVFVRVYDANLWLALTFVTYLESEKKALAMFLYLVRTRIPILKSRFETFTDVEN